MSGEQTKYKKKKNIFIFLSKKNSNFFHWLEWWYLLKTTRRIRSNSGFQWNRNETKRNETKWKEWNKEKFYNWNISESKMTMFVWFEFSGDFNIFNRHLNQKKNPLLRINQYVLVQFVAVGLASLFACTHALENKSEWISKENQFQINDAHE